MKYYKEYITRKSPRPEYQLYPHRTRERGQHDHATQEVGCQYEIKRDNVVCTCRNTRLRRAQEGFFGLPKQIYAYHGTRSFADIGVGSVKTLMRKKVKRIYLPETDDRGVGSSDLSSVIIRNARQRENSYYNHKRTSSKCVGGTIEYITGCVLSKKLSPIIQTVSGTTSPMELSLNKNQEIGSNNVIHSVITKTTQVDTDVNDKGIVHDTIIRETVHHSSIREGLKVAKQSKDRKSKLVNATKSIDAKARASEIVYSSDSLEQHVHNLEACSEEKPSHTSVDPMENKLEREYRRIFSTKSKDAKPSKEGTPSKEEKPRSGRTNSDIKSSSILKRRFEALRRGLVKKEDSKRSAALVIKASSQMSAASHKDVSIASDPPSLESRSYSNTKPFSPYTSVVEPDRIYAQRAAYRDSVSSGKDKGSIQWSRTGEDSDPQGVKGMFKLWGKKFNLEEDLTYCKKEPRPVISISKKSGIKAEVPKIPPKDLEEKKEGKKFFFFKRKSKDKTKPYKPKKGVTTGRCEVKDGLIIKIGGATQPEIIPEPIPKVIEDYDEIIKNAWLKKYLTQAIESRNSVKIRWNNKTYATSSSTVFELMDNVYKEAGVMLKSKSEVNITESSYYQSFTRQQVNFVYQNIEAWMISKTMPDRPKDLPVQINFKSSKEEKDNIEFRISDQKWFIDKSKAFSHQIEVVLHSKNFVQKKKSSEYLRIDIPKGFFVDSSSDEKRNQSSDEQVYNIVEYETGSEIKRNRTTQSLCTGDNVYNNIEVTVNVKTSHELEPKVLETVIKTSYPAVHRDEVIQGSNVYIPKRCDVIGVGIITQRDLREIRKPILKIRDDVSDVESEHTQTSNHNKSEFAKSYLQDYCRHWTPLGLDFSSWRVSDSHLRCCSENSKSTFNNPADGSRSCPNILDDIQPDSLISSCDTSSCSQCIAFVDETKANDNFSSKFFAKLKNNKKEKKDSPARGLPKDSIEVFKRRKIYALSNKSKWACVDDEPYSVPSNESRGAENSEIDCPKVNKPYSKDAEIKPKKISCKKHVSMPQCDTGIKSEDKELNDKIIPGIIAFKGSAGCTACKDRSNPKSVVINSDSIIEIPQAPCRESCEKIKKPPCAKLTRPTSNVAQPCNQSCRLNKTPSPPCSPTKKPRPPVKKTCTSVMKQTSPPAKKTMPTKIPSPVGKKRCPPTCRSEEKPPHRQCDFPVQPGSQLGTPCNPSPTGSASSPCKTGASPLGSPEKLSPTGSGSSPCKAASRPAGNALGSPGQRATVTKKCFKSPPESGETSPPRDRSYPSPHYKRPCLNKQASPVSNQCSNSPPKALESCCSPHCKGLKASPKCPPSKIPQLRQTRSGEDPCFGQSMRPSGSGHKLPGPQELTPGNTPNSSNYNTQKKTGSICQPCAKLLENLCKKSSQQKPSHCLPPQLPQGILDPERRNSNEPCTYCNTNNQEFPWPLKNQISNQSLMPKCQSAHTENIHRCAGKTTYSPRIEGLECCDTEVTQTCTGPPCIHMKNPSCLENQTKKGVSSAQVPLPTNSKPISSGIQLKKKPRKTNSSTKRGKCQDYGYIKLSSKENLTIRMKAETPSTEEIREIGQGLNIKVQDDDGQTLYERRDYRTQCMGGQHRPSVLGDMYRQSNVINSLHRISTQVIGEAITSNKPDNDIKDKSDASLSNTIEIQFRMKVTQGDKTTEIGIANEDDVKAEQKTFKPPEEVFVIKNESVHSNESKDAKNDINIRIVIKNFKSKSDKKKPKCYVDEFSREISDKFHTVSTAYSDNLCDARADNVYSVHRATVDLTKSGNISTTDGFLNDDAKAFTDTKPINILMSAHSTKQYNAKVEETEIYQQCNHKDVTKEFSKNISEKGDSIVNRDPNAIGFLKSDITEDDITDNDDTERSEAQKPGDFTKRNYLSDKYDYTDIDTEKEDLTERDLTEKDDLTDRNDLTERDDLTEKDDLTGADELTEKEDFSEKDELTKNYELTDKEDLNQTDDDAKKILKEKESSHKKTEVKYKKGSARKSFQQNYEAPISIDTDEQDLVLEANTSTDNDTAGSVEVFIKPHTRQEKKEMLKKVFEKAHATKVKSKTHMRKLRDMLKFILTSDSSGHDELKVNELAENLTYASLKPNYFRDSDSMNNYYNCEPMSDKDSVIRTAVYPTEEKNSECSKSSDVFTSEEQLLHRECMCKTLATRLNLCKATGGGCCCSKPTKKDEEIVCDLRSDYNIFDIKTDYVDAETQNSKHFYKNNTSVHSYRESSIIETCNIVKVETPGVSDMRKDRKLLKIPFSPHVNNIKELSVKKFNRDTTILTISDDDKIVLHGESKIYRRKYDRVAEKPVIRSSDVLQSYEAKKAVLEIYAERTVSEDGEHFVAKLPKFVYDRENELVMNYEAIAANNYTAVCKRNVIMMSTKRYV